MPNCLTPNRTASRDCLLISALETLLLTYLLTYLHMNFSRGLQYVLLQHLLSTKNF